MKQYIDKSAVVAEINKRIIDAPINNIGHQRVWAYNDVKDIIDTLEVKEVDLDEVKIGETQIYIEDDGGEPPYDGKQWLDLECLEYEILKDKFKDGDNVEIIIRKTQKEAQRESDFVMGIIKKEHRQPTFSDAIEYGRNNILSELEKIVKDKEEAGKNYVFAFSEVKELIERLKQE